MANSIETLHYSQKGKEDIPLRVRSTFVKILLQMSIHKKTCIRCGVCNFQMILSTPIWEEESVQQK